MLPKNPKKQKKNRAKDYDKNDKEILRDNERDKYRKLSEEEKKKKKRIWKK